MERGPPQKCSFALPQKLGGPETPRSSRVGAERAAGSSSLASPQIFSAQAQFTWRRAQRALERAVRFWRVDAILGIV